MREAESGAQGPGACQGGREAKARLPVLEPYHLLIRLCIPTRSATHTSELHTSGRPLCAATPGPQSLSAAEYQLTNSATLVHVLQFSDAILLAAYFHLTKSPTLRNVSEPLSCSLPISGSRGIVRPLGQLLREVVSQVPPTIGSPCRHFQLAIPPGKAALLLLAVRGDPGDETDFNSTQCAPIVHAEREQVQMRRQEDVEGVKAWKVQSGKQGVVCSERHQLRNQTPRSFRFLLIVIWPQNLNSTRRKATPPITAAQTSVPGPLEPVHEVGFFAWKAELRRRKGV
ncbi:hypothetical protein B0H11DRAFT_1943366 [Mycena galericulata]|nr:hypothetical protein B0H11DRAFT_1943366 [Mycena galericulata]